MALKGLGRGTRGARHRFGLEIVRRVGAAPSPPTPSGAALSILLETGESLLLETGYNLLLEASGSTPSAVAYNVLLENDQALNLEIDQALLVEL